MKTVKLVVLAVLLFTASISYAQFEMSAGAGYGIRLSSTDAQFNYQVGLNVLPNYQFGEFNVGVQSYVIIANAVDMPEVFTGAKLSYRIYENNNHPLNISARWLYASGGSQLIGGGLNYGINKAVTVGVDIGSQYSTKQMYSEVNLNYNFIR